VLEILRVALRPNQFFSNAATEQARARAAAKIPDKYSTYREGQPIVYKGDKVSVSQLEVLRAFGMMGDSVNRLLLIGVALMNGILLLMLERFLTHFMPQSRRNRKELLLMGLCLLLVLLLANIIAYLPHSRYLVEPLVLLPVAAIGTMMAVLLQPLVAAAVMAVSALQLGCLLNLMCTGWFTFYFLHSFQRLW